MEDMLDSGLPREHWRQIMPAPGWLYARLLPEPPYYELVPLVAWVLYRLTNDDAPYDYVGALVIEEDMPTLVSTDFPGFGDLLYETEVSQARRAFLRKLGRRYAMRQKAEHERRYAFERALWAHVKGTGPLPAAGR